MPAPTTRPSTAQWTLLRLVEALHSARVEQGISPQVIAEALDTSRERVDAWESGRTQVTLPVLIEWALALDLDIEFRPRELPRAHTQATSPEARLLAAFAAADRDKREAISVLLGLHRPARVPVVVELRRGRPLGAGRASGSLRLTPAQHAELEQTPVPHTGNRLLTALKLTDTTIRQLASASNLRYSTVAKLVAGRRKVIPPGYADHLAGCFGCAPIALFPLIVPRDAHNSSADRTVPLAVVELERRVGLERRAIARGPDRRAAQIPVVFQDSPLT